MIAFTYSFFVFENILGHLFYTMGIILFRDNIIICNYIIIIVCVYNDKLPLDNKDKDCFIEAFIKYIRIQID